MTLDNQATEVIVKNQDTIKGTQGAIVKNQDTIKGNQGTIVKNQDDLKANQKTIIKNQEAILKNQQSLLKNQDVIVANQASIITNQTQIVDNQVALSVISATQVHILNALRKLGGEKESLKATTEFLGTLRAKAEKAVKSKKLSGPKKL